MKQKSKKRWAQILAGLIAVVAAFAIGAVTVQEAYADGHSHNGWIEWNNNSSLPSNPGKYYLADDVTLSDTWTLPPRQVTISLCLNGHSITMKSGGDAISISNNCTLNLYDCKTAGTITHASGKTGSGVYIEGGTFNMYGGTISGNEATTEGGGVWVQRGTFNMSGGTISGNKATDGGGVFVFIGTFNMIGGTITENTASGAGGGIAVAVIGTIQLSGSPQITGNTANGKADNMYLGDSAKAEITGGLNTPEGTSGPQIGVSMIAPGVFTSGLKNKLPFGKTASDLFFSDNGNYAVTVTDDHEAQLVRVVKMNGDGTKTSPYEITSYADLNEFASIVNGTHLRVSQNTAACGKLMDDIIAKNSPTDSEYAHDWVPIGTEEHPYTGHFDGNNKVIKGLSNEERPDVNSADHQGLFGYIGSGGSVVDAGLEDGKIRGSYSGGVAGQNAGAITNCYNTGAVTGGDHVGGVAAQNTGTITDCYNTGEITGGAYEGGVVALNEGTITNCYNTASFGSGQVCCGGIAAQNEGTGTITNCYNTGAIDPGSDAGGVAGQNAGTIKSCYNIGEVSAGANQAGGMAGLNEGTITNCYNSGDVSAGGNHAGGIAGLQNKGKITSCYNTGAVGPVGGDHAGGVAGCLEGGEITNCYNTGTVGPAGGTGVGGVAASNKGTITNCYNIGAVRGYVPGGVAEGNSGTITNCYYDKVFCTAKWAIFGEENTDTVKDLSTSEMTGDSAIGENHMAFSFSDGEENPWLVRANEVDEANGEYCEYYPHLKGFNFDSEGKPLEAEDIALADWPAKHIIKQAQPEIIILPIASAITEGQSLTDSRFSGGLAKAGDTEVPGTFAWTDSAIKPKVSDSGKTEYKVTFTPNDTKNYKKATTRITLTVNRPVPPATSIDNAPVVLDPAPLTYTGQPVTPVIQTIGGRKLQEGRDYAIRYTQGDTLIEAPTDAGTYTMTITGRGNYAGSTSTEFTIDKAAGTLTAAGNKVKARSKTIKLKKANKISAEKAYTIEGAIGELTYAKVGASKASKKFKVNATTGQIKAKKGLKKGRYKLTVLISDPGDKNHETAEAKAVVTIKIKR